MLAVEESDTSSVKVFENSALEMGPYYDPAKPLAKVLPRPLPPRLYRIVEGARESYAAVLRGSGSGSDGDGDGDGWHRLLVLEVKGALRLMPTRLALGLRRVSKLKISETEAPMNT